MLTCFISAVRVLCERLLHVKLASGEKALRNMDLSWLLRILCKLSADPESKLKPEASFTLAKLVKAAGPELITRPIYFLLVMENDGVGHRRGSQGSKTKAAALDTLTYALLSFPKEEFDDLEEISRWVWLSSVCVFIRNFIMCAYANPEIGAITDKVKIPIPNNCKIA